MDGQISAAPDLERYEDDSEYWERRYDPLLNDRRARRKRKPVARHIPKVAEEDVVADLGDLVGLEGGFSPTYTPGLYEHGWLLDSLRDFYNEGLIVDVLAQIKGGKEASVYLCKAHPSTGVTHLAAKVYRPRKFRNLRNDKVYRQGRAILAADGKPVRKSDHRTMRALGKKTAFGLQVSHTSWLMHEYRAMAALHALGGAVPRPYASTRNAILMGYCGDEREAASTLNRIRLAPQEAQSLFDLVIQNVELLLQCELIHGDLSAYNILYWDGTITLIDFPQVVDVYNNREAMPILARDVERVCAYFARQGAHHEAGPIVERLWARYGPPALWEAADVPLPEPDL